MKFYREAQVKVKIRNADFSGYTEEVTIKNLRISFSIVKSLAWSANTCNVKIWNMKQETRNLIKDYGDEVTVYAGYRDEGDLQIIFVGDTTAVIHMYDQPEIISIFECSDGDKYINQRRVAVSFVANTPVNLMIQIIAEQMGLNIAELATANDLVYRQGFEFIGMGKDALTTLCSKLGLQWSVQNDDLQIIPLDGTIQQPIVQINQNTGMQGIPQRFTYRRLDLYRAITAPTTGWKVNVALNPKVAPGAKIDLASTHIDFKGPYRVENVRHEGDTFGSTWSSQFEVTELASGATI